MAFKFFHIRGPQLESLFKSWHDILSWYELEEQDLPYWYLERTNIGHLALAVYQRSGIPIQEFSCLKGRGAKNSSGRADLYITLPNKSGPQTRINIEAKQAWCSVKFNDRSRATLNTKLEEAVDDCKKIKEKDWKEKDGMGLLFLIPYAKKMQKNKRDIAQEQCAFTTEVYEASKAAGASFVAFHYPLNTLLLKISRKNRKHDWCPGIAVVGKLIS